VHRHYSDLWAQLADRVELEGACQFCDHVAQQPGRPPSVGRTSMLRGSLGKPLSEEFSRTIHYEISGAGRIDFQVNDAYVGAKGDPHPVVLILRIDLFIRLGLVSLTGCLAPLGPEKSE
jgi:hypothetical protein